MPLDYYSALRLLALKAIQEPDEAANTRYVYRWYSKTFHTPLHIVEELDPQDVFTAFYEGTYEEMSEEDREREIADLLETPEEKRAKAIAKDHERSEMFEFAQMAAEQERKKETKRLSDLETKQKQPFANRGMVPEVTLPKPKLKQTTTIEKLEPDIEMKFVSADDFEKELSGFGSMMPGSKPQSSS